MGVRGWTARVPAPIPCDGLTFCRVPRGSDAALEVRRDPRATVRLGSGAALSGGFSEVAGSTDALRLPWLV